ncbi:MAG: response regulator [Paludibacter sp.]
MTPRRKQCLEPFFTTKGERGTGMGLAMVYGMARRHSAELQIDSNPGAGTTMRLLFASATSLAAEARHINQLPALRPLRILLVDDDPLIIAALREALQHDGHQVITADGGQAGIDTFHTTRAGSQQPALDVVITDLGMPYVDGRRVAAAIKAGAPELPVIMLTGWGQRLLDDGATPAHVDRVLSKPPRLDQLRRTLVELLSPASSPRQPEQP